MQFRNYYKHSLRPRSHYAAVFAQTRALTLRRRNLKGQHSSMVLYLYLRESLLVKPHDYPDFIVVEKLRFPSTLKREVGVFRFLRFEERSRKAPFS